MSKKEKVIITKNLSTHLFLSNLTNEKKAKNLLDSLQHKLNFTRNRNIAKKQEEEKILPTQRRH